MFTYGFYDSMNGDRKYNATQMASIFDGIIQDGVYSNVGEQFAVVPGTGLQIIIKTGRAWFNHTWSLNDSWLPINLDGSDPVRSRIDSVVLEVNSNIAVRENSLKIIKGSPATSPVAPGMEHTDEINQYRLADITIRAGASSIIGSDISIKVGQGETPFVTAPLKAADISFLFEQWNSQFSNSLIEWEGEFSEWFANIKLQLTEDVVTNLQKQIDERVKTADKATSTNLSNGTANKWVDASLIKSNVIKKIDDLRVFNTLEIGDIVYSERDLETLTSGKMLACDQRQISKTTYPTLCANSKINPRLAPLDRGNYFSCTALTNLTFINGRVHDGYLYLAQLSNSTLTITRRRIDNVNASEERIIQTTITVSSANPEYSGIYITSTKIYLLTFYSSDWYEINISTGTLTKYSASAGTSINVYNGYIRAAVRSDGGVNYYQNDYRIVYTNNTTFTVYRYQYIVSYSNDFKTRTTYNNEQTETITPSTGVSSSFYTINFTTPETNNYTNELKSYQNGLIVYGFLILPTTPLNNARLVLWFVENNTVTRKEYSPSDIGIFQASYYSGFLTTNGKGYIITTSQYVYLFYDIQRNYVNNKTYYGTWCLIINRSTKNVVKYVNYDYTLFVPQIRSNLDLTSGGAQGFVTDKRDYLYGLYYDSNESYGVRKITLNQNLTIENINMSKVTVLPTSLTNVALSHYVDSTLSLPFPVGIWSENGDSGTYGDEKNISGTGTWPAIVTDINADRWGKSTNLYVGTNYTNFTAVVLYNNKIFFMTAPQNGFIIDANVRVLPWIPNAYIKALT